MCFADEGTRPGVELLEISGDSRSSHALGDRVYLRLRVASNRDYRVRVSAMSNGVEINKDYRTSGSPLYSTTHTEVMVWYASQVDLAVDTWMFRLTDQTGQVFFEQPVSADTKWRSDAPKNTEPLPKWVADLQLASETLIDIQAKESAGKGLLSNALAQFLLLLVPGVLALQIWSLFSIGGQWRRPVIVSGFLMGSLVLFVVVATLSGSNLAPIWLIFTAPLFFAFLVFVHIKVRLESQERSE